MKPLNRPMFRYGGPIKEGVMSGIREPKKNGGSMMANDEGPRRAALVGNPIYPKGPDGRTNHVLPFIIGQGLRMAARPFGKFVASRFAGPVQQGSQKLLTTVANAGKPIKGGFDATKFNPNAIGNYFLKSPEGRLIAGSTGFAGKVGRGALKGGKYLASSPLTLGGGLIYAGGKFFKDGKEVPPPPNADKLLQGRVGTSGAPGGGDPGMYLEPQTKKGGGVELTAEQLRKKNVERYRDIMDIKGMNKDAAYNSLIAASQAINESGDFKGDIKSGKLINQIIQATSKQFDKPKATKDAIDTLILKGEIEKDIKASDPSSKIANELNLARIDKLNKELEGNSFAEAKAIMRKAGSKGQNEITDAAKSLEDVNYQGTLISKSDFKDVIETAKNTLKTEGGTLSEEQIIEGFATNFIVDKNAPDGEYIVGDAIISIRDGQVVPGSVRR